MSRFKKSRYWDKKNKIFVPDYQKITIDFVNMQYRFLVDGNWLEIPFSECEEQRPTGLKDSEGALIYEGDVVEMKCYDGWFIGVVKITPRGTILKNSTRYFHEKDNTCISNPILCGSRSCVIGNIYENPELMEVE